MNFLNLNRIELCIKKKLRLMSVGWVLNRVLHHRYVMQSQENYYFPILKEARSAFSSTMLNS